MNKKANSLKKGAYIATAIALTFMLALNTACAIMSDTITFWLCNSSELDSATREAGEALATQIEEEGIILTKNEGNVLPLATESKKVNVFGWTATEWVPGGSGSGRVTNNYAGSTLTPEVGLLEALEEAGVEYNTAITSMYEDFQKNREGWASGTLNVNSQEFYRLYEPSITDTAYYTESMLVEAEAFSKIAIVALGRVAGESNDCASVQYKRVKKGGPIQTDKSRSYLDISTEEQALLEYVGKRYEKVIVVINSTNVMNLGFMDSIEGLDACLIVGGTGIKAANGVVNVLYGKATPSGRTADTYAYDFKTSPAYWSTGDQGTQQYTNSAGMYPSNKGTVNGDDHYKKGVSYVDYVEGIYVGYKWYETADAEGYWADVDNGFGKGYEGVVQYPFGYGLSYTTFDWDVVNVTPKAGALDVNGKISVQVRVTNTGAVKGKEVVQLYYTAPYTKGGIEKSSINLVAFAKTPIDVEPGESQLLTLTFDVRDMASYDSQGIKVSGGGYLLEKGDYAIKLMKNAHELAEVDRGEAVYTYTLAQDYIYTFDAYSDGVIHNHFTGENAIDGFSIDGSTSGENITFLSRNDFKGTFKSELAPARTMSQEMKDAHMYSMKDAEAWLARQKVDKLPTQGVEGEEKIYEKGEKGYKVTDLGLELGNPENYYNDELWDKVLDQITLREMITLTAHGYTKEEKLPSIGKDFWTQSVDGPNQIGSFNKSPGTGYPNSTVLAQSWNTQLGKSFGLAIASEAMRLGYTGWYGPGINIHRTPFGGRNYEYYSEDPCLSGGMGASVVNGCLDGGVYCYMKHFAIYEQETCRDSLYTWMTEQTLRETYLDPFKTCIEDAGLTGMMSAYGRIGAKWAGGSEALLTELLRKEWGFNGAVITDYADHHEYMNGDQMLRAGGDLWMDGVSAGSYKMETSSGAMKVRLRDATKHILFMILNAEYRVANATDDGIEINRANNVFAWWIPVLIGVDAIVVGICAVACFSTYKKNKLVKESLQEDSDTAQKE